MALIPDRQGRFRELPKLETLTGRRKPKKPQTEEQMLGIVKMLNAMYGGKVIDKKGRG